MPSSPRGAAGSPWFAAPWLLPLADSEMKSAQRVSPCLVCQQPHCSVPLSWPGLVFTGRERGREAGEMLTPMGLAQIPAAELPHGPARR